MNTDKSLVDIIFIDEYYLFCEFEFKIVATSLLFSLRWLRRKVSCAKVNPSLHILVYSTLRPKFKTQIWISNSFGAKFSRWHLGINSFWSQLRSLLELSRWHLGITSFWHQLISSLVLEIPGDSLSGIPLCFLCHLGINSFWRQLGYLLELSRWHLGINSFWRQLGSSLGLGILGYSFSGIPICFPPLEFHLIIRLWETKYFPVGFLVCFYFLGELHIFRIFSWCLFIASSNG